MRPIREFAFVQLVGRPIVTIGVTALALTLAPANPFPGRQDSDKDKLPFTYQRVVLTEPATYQRKNVCIAFLGSVTSADFFEGLRPVTTDMGRKFFRGTTEVKEFPEELTLEIRATAMRNCSKVPPEPLSEAASEPLMKKLSFKINWKAGLQQRPAERLSAQLNAPEPRSWVDPGPGPTIWRYDFTVDSKGVPLTDHLVVEVFSEGDQFLARVSVRL